MWIWSDRPRRVCTARAGFAGGFARAVGWKKLKLIRVEKYLSVFLCIDVFT